MNVFDVISSRRTVRKFKRDPLSDSDLIKIVDAGRLAASGANRQPIKYAIISSEDMCAKVFPHTKWAGYIDWNPMANDSPAAYIAIIADNDIKPIKACEVDAGLVMSNMMLAAEALGIGSCALGSIDREDLHKMLNLPESYYVSYLLALGYPAQTADYFDASDVKYYHDENQNVHVPKRPIDEVLIKKI